MATTKTVKLYKKFKDPKTGRIVKKVVGTKTTNTVKGSGQANLSKNQLKALEITSGKQQKLAEIAGRQANVLNIATQTGQTIRSAIGSKSGSVTNTGVSGRDDSNNNLANGGLNQGSNQRDEDDYSDLVS